MCSTPRPKEMRNKRQIGKTYEQLATTYLKHKGYEILENNYRCKLGEIDIIAKQAQVFVFVEVKYRKTDAFGEPREAVNYYKQKRIRRAAQYYLKGQNGYECNGRFDVIEILGDAIWHLEAVF